MKLKIGAAAVAGSSGRLRSPVGSDCTASADTETAETATGGSGGSDRGGLCVNCTAGSRVVLAPTRVVGGCLVPSAALLAASTEGLAVLVVVGKTLAVDVVIADSRDRVVATVATLLLGRAVVLLVVGAGNVRTAVMAGTGLAGA